MSIRVALNLQLDSCHRRVIIPCRVTENLNAIHSSYGELHLGEETPVQILQIRITNNCHNGLVGT